MLAYQVTTTPAQTLSASQWRIVVAACSAHGFLHASLEARSSCRDRDIESAADLRRYVIALVDRDGGSARWHDRASSAIADDPWLTCYLQLLRGAAPAEHLHPNYLDRLVAGRLVALVGSAVMELGLGTKIDSHEIVARTKYLGAAFAQPAAAVGRRTTIAYFNKASVALVGSASGAARRLPSPDLSDLALIVSKRPVESTGVPQLQLRVSCPTYLGPALLGSRAMLHLLAARPRALSVFGMDFYLADQPHYPGDLNERDRAARGAVRDNAHYCLAFAQHDPFSQIRFVRHLAEAGAITPYGRTAEVLAMTDLEYAKGLETRYGRWDRP